MNLLALALVLGQYTNPYTGVTWNNPMSSYLDTVIYNRIWTSAMNRGIALSNQQKQKPPPQAPAPKAPFSASDFKPAGPRTVAQAMVAASRGITKEQAQALVEGLNAGIDVFEKEARKNNVAYALAFLIGISVQTLTDREVPDAQAEELAQLINDELAQSASFKKVPAKQKQLLYETSIVVGALIGGMAAQATEANDVELREQAKDLARSALATFSGGR